MDGETKRRSERRAGGRPRKFGEPSKPVTLTLPERILGLLSLVDSDRACAIAKVTEAALGTDARKAKHWVKLVDVEPGLALIVVGPSATLQRIPWLRLVEIAPARFILVIPPGTALESMEVAIIDLLENLTPENEDERPMLEELRARMGHLRRERKMTKSEIILVDTTINGRASPAASHPL